MSQLEHHVVSIMVKRSASETFAFMSDPARLGEWAFENGQVDTTGLATGSSRFDGTPVCAKIDADSKRLSIDYLVGGSADRLTPRIAAKVIRGSHLDLGDDVSGLSLLAWRGADMSDLRWRQLVAAHEMEILLIKNLIERPTER